jgi:uncharacterized protein YacL
MKYYFKVWLFTILVSPLFVIAVLAYHNSKNISDFFSGLPIWLFAVIFGSVLALPALFLFRLLNKDLEKHNIPILLKKLIHAIVGIVLLWITFYVTNRDIFEELSWNNIAWPLAYSTSLIIGSFIYKVQEDQT